MEKLTELEQLRRAVLRMVADIVQRTGELAETMNGALEELERKGPWLPIDGSGAMGGDLDMGPYRIKFGNGTYLGFAEMVDIDSGDGPAEESPAEEEVTAGEICEDDVIEEITEGDTTEVGGPGEEITEEEPEEDLTLAIFNMHSANLYANLFVADPLFRNHAATKGYVDSLVGDIGALLDEINGEVV